MNTTYTRIPAKDWNYRATIKQIKQTRGPKAAQRFSKCFAIFYFQAKANPVWLSELDKWENWHQIIAVDGYGIPQITTTNGMGASHLYRVKATPNGTFTWYRD